MLIFLQKARPLLMKAHESLLGDTDLLTIARNLSNDEFSAAETGELLLSSDEQSFVELGSVWQASLYEITLNFHQDDDRTSKGGLFSQ